MGMINCKQPKSAGVGDSNTSLSKMGQSMFGPVAKQWIVTFWLSSNLVIDVLAFVEQPLVTSVAMSYVTKEPLTPRDSVVVG
jgi:hypothetical protein